MLRAIKAGDLEKVRNFLEFRNNVDKTKFITLPEDIANIGAHNATVNVTLLQCAVLYNKFNILEFLINAGANINSQDEYKNTALFYSIRNYTDINIVKLLIEHGIDINHKNMYGMTPLYVAVSQNMQQVVELFLQKGANVDFPGEIFTLTPLHLAAMHTNLQILEILVSYGADVNAKCLAGRTCLHKIAYVWYYHQIKKDLMQQENINEFEYWRNVEDIVHFLTNQGADINSEDERNFTPLHIAVSLNDVKTASIFLKYGAIVDTLNMDNNSPLSTATESQYLELIHLLLNNNANINFKVNYKSPLHHVAELGDINILNILLERNPNIDNLLHYEETPFIYAIRGGNMEIIKRLIDYGVNVNLKKVYFNEITSLQEAILLRNIEIVDLLLKNGADVNLETDGYSPLHRVILSGDENILKLLLKYGPNINTQSPEGTTLILAIKYKKIDLIPLLLEYGADVNTNWVDDYCTILYYLIHKEEHVIVDMLLLHILHLKASKKYISPQNLDTFYDQMKIRSSCFEKEFERLKNNFVLLNPKVSLYDVYTKKKCLHQIFMCCRDKEVRSILKNNLNILYLRAFASYSTIMKNKIKELIEEAEVFDQSHDLLRSIIESVASLPVEITTYIMNFLSYTERKDFIDKWEISL